MSELEAARTLVKSTPELWAACSDPDTLGRHLQAFGEIKITRLEPETTVAWEGESASGTVVLEPSGWGTKVILRTGADAAVVRTEVKPEPEPEPEPEIDSEPVVEVVPEIVVEAPPALRIAATGPAEQRPGKLAGWIGGLLGKRAVAPEPAWAEPEPEPEPAVAVAVAVAVAAEPEPVPVVPLAPSPALVAAPPRPTPARESQHSAPNALAALEAALDSLGQAHHRPFSRS
jgi:hypothetical protein